MNSRFGGCANKNRSLTPTRTSTIGSHQTYNSSQKNVVEHTEVTLFEKIEKLFKEKLQLSPEFFKLFLITDKNNLMNSITKLIEFIENRESLMDQLRGNRGSQMDWKYNQDSNNWMAIYGTTFDINTTFQACFCMDLIGRQNDEVSKEYFKLIKNEISRVGTHQLSTEWREYITTKKRISDAEILEVRRELIEYLKQTQKEISNAGDQQLRESFFEIRQLRVSMMNYLIQTKNENSDAEAQKLKKYGMDLIFPPYFQHLITHD